MSDSFQSPLNRRDFLLLAGATMGAAACKEVPPPTCTDVSSLDERRKTLRATLAYEEPCADRERACNACVQYVAGAEGQCCGCKLDIGPVSPIGTCLAFGNA